MWVTVCIYMTVIAWTYSILILLALLQDKAFQHTLVASRFARRVARMHTPFYLVCGCGETGSLICRALDLLGYDFVILEKDAQRVEELDLEDFKTNDPDAGRRRQPVGQPAAGRLAPSVLQGRAGGDQR